MQLCALARKCTRQTQGNHLNKMKGEKKGCGVCNKDFTQILSESCTQTKQVEARQGNEVFVTFYFAIIVRIVSMYFMQK